MSCLRHGKERSGASDAALSSVFASTSPLVGLSCYATKVAFHIKPPPTRTILMSNDSSSSSSQLLIGEGETVWKRETWRENRDTRKDESSWVGRELRPLEEILFDNKGCLWRTSSTLRGLTLSQSRGETTHFVLRAQLQILISSWLRLIII